MVCFGAVTCCLSLAIRVWPAAAESCYYPTETTCYEFAETYCGNEEEDRVDCVWVPSIAGSPNAQLLGRWECPEGTPEFEFKNKEIHSSTLQGAIPGVLGFSADIPAEQDCYVKYLCGCPESIGTPKSGGSSGKCKTKGTDLDDATGEEDVIDVFSDPCPENDES